ncbi:MAG: hypothetical protein PHQ72_06220 [Hespellia sp.]|jgi:hypothetical protein|nr:hypothetical protein [Hespellia sp.]
MTKDYDSLSAEEKLLIVNGQTLVNETREKVKMRTKALDLTCRFQLRDDCKAIEKCIQKLSRSGGSEPDMKKLELAIIRLQTSAKGILES